MTPTLGDLAAGVVGGGGVGHTGAGVYLSGLYRALVRARWDEAVRRGTPALVVQAGQMSRPILEGLGFQPVCKMHAFVDSTA